MNKNQSVGMYIILGIMVLAFISMFFTGTTSKTEELSYTSFLQKVENKEIKSVELGKDVLIALPVKQPETKQNTIYNQYCFYHFLHKNKHFSCFQLFP